MSTTTSADAWAAWCPDDTPWSTWAKPLLFATPNGPTTFPEGPVVVPPLPQAVVDTLGPDTFVIADLAGADCVGVGLALSRHGLRPVPLFNGVPDSMGIVNSTTIRTALHEGTAALRAASLRHDAPPAFLIDAHRMTGAPEPGRFDNRWVVIPEDFPSANRLLSHGLRRCLLLALPAYHDLDHVLVRFADAGIRIDRIERDRVVPHTVRRPSWFRTVFSRAAVQVGLRRSSAGGFGAIVPIPESGGG